VKTEILGADTRGTSAPRTIVAQRRANVEGVVPTSRRAGPEHDPRQVEAFLVAKHPEGITAEISERASGRGGRVSFRWRTRRLKAWTGGHQRKAFDGRPVGLGDLGGGEKAGPERAFAQDIGPPMGFLGVGCPTIRSQREAGMRR